MGEDEICQTLRKLHCAHNDANKSTHTCIGTCTIKPSGILLDCKLCGVAVDSIYMSPEATKLNKALNLIGISFNFINPDIYRKMLEVLFN